MTKKCLSRGIRFTSNFGCELPLEICNLPPPSSDAGTSSGQPSKRHFKSLKIGVVGGVAVT